MFNKWRTKRKIKKAATQLVEEAINAYLDLSMYDGLVSTKVQWRNSHYFGFSNSYDNLEETTITISTRTLYKKIAPPPHPSRNPCPPMKNRGPARASNNPAPEILPTKDNNND